LSNLEEQLTKIHKLYVQSHNRYYYYGYQQTMAASPSSRFQSYPLLIEETGYFRPLEPQRPWTGTRFVLLLIQYLVQKPVIVIILSTI